MTKVMEGYFFLCSRKSIAMRLDEKLQEYSKKDYYPFHMPGHKRRVFPLKGENPFAIDITEIDGFDNLHHAEGILKEAQDRAAKIFRTERSFYSVNGSTAALLAAISAALPRGASILIGRNAHKAVYHGIYLRGLKSHYIYPKEEKRYGLNGGIDPKEVEKALKSNPEIGAVLITSPTYDGVVSDIKAIGEITKKYQKILIVDEAHGAHFSLAKKAPVSACNLGADLVIQSLHKTLPALTQTALLHSLSKKVSKDKIQYFMSIYQTSSPSYLLMASMDACLSWIEDRGQISFGEYYLNLDWFRQDLKDLKKIKLVGREVLGESDIYDYDESKVVLSLKETSFSGPDLSSILLKDYHIQVEMAAKDYVILLTGVGDDKEGFKRAVKALKQIDKAMEKRKKVEIGIEQEKPLSVKTIEDAMEDEAEKIPLRQSAGYISQEFIYAYPPGIPLLVPGEKITERLIKEVEEKIKLGLDIQGLKDYNNDYILVLKER